MAETVKFTLGEENLPKTWYNIAANLPVPVPFVLHPGTKQPVGPDDLAPIFPMAITVSLSRGRIISSSASPQACSSQQRRGPTGTRGQSCREGDHRRGPQVQSGRGTQDHPVQPVRTWPFRHAGLSRLHGRQAHRSVIRPVRTRHGARRPTLCRLARISHQIRAPSLVI